MAEFSFNQLIYGSMVSIAGVDGSVSSLETKYVNHVFDEYLIMSPKEKQDIHKIWERKGEQVFTDFLIEELLTFPKHDQIIAFSYVMKYINWAKTQYNQSTQKELEEFVSLRAELDMYHKRAEYIMRSLSFSAKEYAIETRTLEMPKH